MRLSRMMASLSSRVAPPPKPSAVSASPSSCSPPVAKAVAPTAISAAAIAGRRQGRGDHSRRCRRSPDRQPDQRKRPGRRRRDSVTGARARAAERQAREKIKAARKSSRQLSGKALIAEFLPQPPDGRQRAAFSLAPDGQCGKVRAALRRRSKLAEKTRRRRSRKCARSSAQFPGPRPRSGRARRPRARRS